MSVNWSSERVQHPAQQRFANGNGERTAAVDNAAALADARGRPGNAFKIQLAQRTLRHTLAAAVERA